MKRTLWIMALGTILASSILVTAAGPRNTQVTGIITAIDSAAQQILVGGVTVQATPTTLFTMKTTSITFADLKVGMTVKVCGKWDIDGDVFIAQKINVMYSCK